MKKMLLIFLFLTPILVVHAQQHPPPKNPKDPDSAAIDTNSAALIDPPIRVSKPDPQQVFTAVEHEPEFPGGMEKLYRYLEKNLRYPAAAKQNNIQGKVFVTFVVEKDGSLTAIKIVRSISPETDAEAIRLIQASPKWSPGIQNGRPVRTQYTLPVAFTLTD